MFAAAVRQPTTEPASEPARAGHTFTDPGYQAFCWWR
jgi:hypothetical protein